MKNWTAEADGERQNERELCSKKQFVPINMYVCVYRYVCVCVCDRLALHMCWCFILGVGILFMAIISPTTTRATT